MSSSITVTVNKPSPDAKVGIKLYQEADDNHQPCLIVSYLADDSLFADTDLQLFYEVVTINGTPVSALPPSQAVAILKTAESEIVVEAKIPASLHTVTATKESVESSVGLSLTKEPAMDAPIVVSKITEDSIFVNEDLKEGFELLSVNGSSVVGKKAADAIALIKAADGELTLCVRKVYGGSVTATADKAAPDDKTGIVLYGVPGKVYIKDYAEDSPFRGLLPIGPSYKITTINSVPVKSLKASDIGAYLSNLKAGPVTIDMDKVA